LISFDGMDGGRAEAARASLADAADTWCPCAGLDRHTPMIGLRISPDAARLPSSPARAPAGVQIGVYRPISAFCTAEQPAL